MLHAITKTASPISAPDKQQSSFDADNILKDTRVGVPTTSPVESLFVITWSNDYVHCPVPCGPPEGS